MFSSSNYHALKIVIQPNRDLRIEMTIVGLSWLYASIDAWMENDNDVVGNTILVGILCIRTPT
jgi:hypothetical protein